MSEIPKQYKLGYQDGKCLVKIFSYEHKHNYPLSKFGSMGEH